MRKAGEVDATIIACFDDTGLDAARSFSAAPVVGIGEAAFHMASHCRQVLRRDHAFPLDSGAGAQPRALRADQPLCPRARRGRRRPRSRNGRSPAARSRGKSPALSRRTMPRRSCSDVPGWRTSRPTSPTSTRLPVLDGVACAVAMCQKHCPHRPTNLQASVVTPPQSRSPQPHKSKSRTPPGTNYGRLVVLDTRRLGRAMVAWRIAHWWRSHLASEPGVQAPRRRDLDGRPC